VQIEAATRRMAITSTMRSSTPKRRSTCQSVGKPMGGPSGRRASEQAKRRGGRGEAKRGRCGEVGGPSRTSCMYRHLLKSLALDHDWTKSVLSWFMQ
jgi:hypothetical protein